MVVGNGGGDTIYRVMRDSSPVTGIVTAHEKRVRYPFPPPRFQEHWTRSPLRTDPIYRVRLSACRAGTVLGDEYNNAKFGYWDMRNLRPKWIRGGREGRTLNKLDALSPSYRPDLSRPLERLSCNAVCNPDCLKGLLRSVLF